VKAIFLALLIAAAALAAPAWVCGTDFSYFHAINSIIDPTHPVGTQWHQLFPNYCRQPYTITGWKDNGDGQLSFCDTLSMTNPEGLTECVHVVDVTITLELTKVNPPDGFTHYWDWTHLGDPLDQPVCTWWEEIYPDKGAEFHIAGWEDNGSGGLDFCDGIIDDSGAQYHVEGVHTDMTTEPADQCSSDFTTWGRIKGLYR